MRPGSIALLAAAVVVVTAGAAFAMLGWASEIPPKEPQPGQSFDQALIARGAELARIGNCNTCHTNKDGAPYAGGLPVPTPFGTIHSTNITPDPETGIGRWSEDAFRRAMHEGVRRDGEHLYPAFPYDHFTKVSAEDVSAIYAFLMTREPVRAENPSNELAFPFNFRPLIAGWKLLFFEPGEFKPDPAQSAEWNHGTYLAEGLAHCGACHTPRNALGAEDSERKFGGGDIENWHAPALNAASPAPVPWNAEQLATYLRKGFVEPHGVAAGPMQDVVNNLAHVPEEDVTAIATYVAASLSPATADRGDEAKATRRRIESGAPLTTSAIGSGPTTSAAAPAHQDGAGSRSEGAIIYQGACAQCHERTGQRISARGIHLAFSKVLHLEDPRNLIHVIDDGIPPPEGTPAATMPGFADVFTDQQMAALVNYLRSTYANQPAWQGVEQLTRSLRDGKAGR